jgi:hypothetical protein
VLAWSERYARESVFKRPELANRSESFPLFFFVSAYEVFYLHAAYRAFTSSRLKIENPGDLSTIVDK